MNTRIAIRPLETLAEFMACHTVQKEVWTFPDELIIPYTQLITIQHNGGMVMGAFEEAKLVGFVFGYLGRGGDGPLYLYSQRMAVLRGYQGRRIAEWLKWAQRAWALGQGLDRVLWTYDPLEAPNASLNIAKLGGIVRQYKRDIYGQHDTPWQRLRREDMALAADWRTKTRELFEHYLGQGYAVTSYARREHQGKRHNFYLLEKEE